jgi:hypothetical protein
VANSKKSRFRARQDILGGVLVLVIFAVGGFLLARGDLIPWPMADKFGWLFIVFGVLAAWDWLVTSYEFDQEELVIRSGLGQSRIALCTIETMQVGAGKLRLKCQQLRGSKWVKIFPRNQGDFLDRLCEKCPWLKRK